MCGSFDKDLYEKIAAPLSVNTGKAFSFDSEDFSILGPFGDGDAAGMIEK